MKAEEMKPHYHRYDSCNKCGGLNNKVTQGNFLDGYMKTKCDDCGHEDNWDYGFFESGQDMVSNCKKYVNLNGKLVNL